MVTTIHDSDEERPSRPLERHRVADAGRTLRGLLAGLLIAAVVALVVDNRHEVRLGWVFGDADAPLWAVLFVTAFAGALIGWLLVHRPHRRPSR